LARNELKEKIVPIFIEEEMRHSYLDYSMSVIVQRALPDVRDGLKPVHRRVLYGMLELGLRPTTAYKKSARVVGEVLGKYHPHGDTAVYDTMVRMVQDFSLRYPLVEGQGNFGSVDGDSPAAMRYTEVRLAPIAEEILRDLDKDTVDFVMNFDESLKEPSVLPTLLPTLVLNGAAGIAVGMATNIPPHNLNEIVDALSALIRNPRLKDNMLMKYIQGPDFPTGAIIYGDDGIEEYFRSGRGRLTVRARASVERLSGDRQRIVVTEIPYQVNKNALIERIAGLIRDRKTDDLSEVRDESDRDGMRIVIELKREVKPEKILNYLYKHTQMQTTFGVILLALVDGQPKILSLKQMLQEFIDFRHDVVLRRIKFELNKAEQRAHILEGLKIALDNIDEIVSLIRKSRNPDTARSALIKRFKLSEIQAQAILDMRLQRLTGLERKKIEEEYLQIIKLIQKLKSMFENKALRMNLIRTELLELKDKYGDERRTEIIGKAKDISLKDMLVGEKVLVSITHKGFINRKLFSKNGIEEKISKEERDEYGITESSYVASNNDYVLFFTNKGYCYWQRVGDIPQTSTRTNWQALARLLNLKSDESVVSYIKIEKFESEKYVFLVTKRGMVKKVSLSDLSNPRREGLVSINLHEGDDLLSVKYTNGKNEILLATESGMAVRFAENDVRSMGCAAAGVKGLSLSSNESVIGMIVIDEKRDSLLTVTIKGYGKRSPISQYPTTRRGGKGVINYKMVDKVGRVVGIAKVRSSDRILIINKKGAAKRVMASKVRQMNRNASGEQIVNLKKGDEVTEIRMVQQHD
jgi:DNA gyrase subunit A